MLIVGTSFATYLFDPDDIVWRLVKDTAAPRLAERACFVTATILIGLGALLCTRVAAAAISGAGEISFAIGLATLAPLSGFLILVLGETFRVLRLTAHVQTNHSLLVSSDGKPAIRRQSAKWGLFLTMLIFTLTLNDRVGEILAAASVALWAFLNLL